MQAWLTRIGIAALLLGGILMTPEAFHRKRINAIGARINLLAGRAGEGVRRIAPRFLKSLALIAVSLFGGVLISLGHPFLPGTSLHDVKQVLFWSFVVGAVVPAILLTAAAVLAVVFFVLWLLSRLLFFATDGPPRLVRTGGIIFLVGGAVSLAATFVIPDTKQSHHRHGSRSSYSVARDGRSSP